MLSFLFWNLRKNPGVAPSLGQLAAHHDVDLFLFAECPAGSAALIDALNAAGKGTYRLADGEPYGPQKVRVATRLGPERLALRFTGGETSVWELRGDELARVLLVTVHLPAKNANFDSHAQLGVARTAAAEVVETEDREGCLNTVVVGDFNMNPYDPGMIMPEGFHGLMTAALAEKSDRQYRGRSYRRLYNPMWTLFGGRSTPAGGSYFWDGYSPNNHFWHILDQVLVRPALLGRLHTVRLLTDDGHTSLLGRDGTPDRERASDHLPLFFRLAV